MVHVGSEAQQHLYAMGDVPGPQAGRVVLRQLGPADHIVADSDSVTVTADGVAVVYEDGRRAFIANNGVIIEDCPPEPAETEPAEPAAVPVGLASPAPAHRPLILRRAP